MPKFKNEFVGFKTSGKLKTQIESTAKEHEMSVAEFVRYITQKYIDDYENKKNKE